MASSLPKPPPPPPPDLEAAVREVTKGYELATELHSLLRQVIPRGDGRLESACRLSKDALQTLASALSTLKPPTRLRASDPLALEISLPCSNGRGGGGGDSRTSTATTEAKTQQTEE